MQSEAYVVVVEGHGDFRAFESEADAFECLDECRAEYTEVNGYSDLETGIEFCLTGLHIEKARKK